jgi:ECF transporter S component (folate family)
MGLEIRLGFIFLSTIAFLFGPLFAFAAGFITSILGFLLFPTGGFFNPLFDLNIGLSGFLFAIFLYKKNYKSEFFIIWISASKIVVNFVCNIFINTHLLIMFGYIPATTKEIVTITRIFKNVALLPGEIIVMLFVLKFVAAYAKKFKFVKFIGNDRKEGAKL